MPHARPQHVGEIAPESRPKVGPRMPEIWPRSGIAQTCSPPARCGSTPRLCEPRTPLPPAVLVLPRAACVHRPILDEGLNCPPPPRSSPQSRGAGGGGLGVAGNVLRNVLPPRVDNHNRSHCGQQFIKHWLYIAREVV